MNPSSSPRAMRLFPPLAAVLLVACESSSSGTAGTPPPVGPTGPLNDTGVVTCSDASGNGLPCPQGGYPGQDAEYGRDATANDDSDGLAGFSFTKLDANGQPLPADAAEWSCVQDSVTGLFWEVKTDDGGLHDRDWTYTWYHSDPATNGGAPGKDAGGSCGGTVADGCDTEKLVAAVNVEGLCGFADWRLPEREELRGLVDYSIPPPGPTIDLAFFPNTRSWYYWSASPYADDADGAWGVDFNDGSDSANFRSHDYLVRLVRGGQ